MSKKKNKNVIKIVVCPICNTETFNTVGKCKCGYEFPYDPIQDEIMVDICSNCRQIQQIKRGYHVGGTYTICPLCKNGILRKLDTLDRWIKKNEDEKQEVMLMIEYESLNNNDKTKVKCPYCHSTDTKKISGLSKAGSVAVFGVFAIGKTTKQWHCNNCKSDF